MGRLACARALGAAPPRIGHARAAAVDQAAIALGGRIRSETSRRPGIVAAVPRPKPQGCAAGTGQMPPHTIPIAAPPTAQFGHPQSRQSPWRPGSSPSSDPSCPPSRQQPALARAAPDPSRTLDSAGRSHAPQPEAHAAPGSGAITAAASRKVTSLGRTEPSIVAEGYVTRRAGIPPRCGIGGFFA